MRSTPKARPLVEGPDTVSPQFPVQSCTRLDPTSVSPTTLAVSNSGGTCVSNVLTASEIDLALRQLPGWKRDNDSIVRVFQFGNFVEAMEFVNQIAAAAETANHHPDITINYNKVTLALVSHDSGGVTQRDIRMAATINQTAGK